jgi:hypothetical protein
VSLMAILACIKKKMKPKDIVNRASPAFLAGISDKSLHASSQFFRHHPTDLKTLWLFYREIDKREHSVGKKHELKHLLLLAFTLPIDLLMIHSIIANPSTPHLPSLIFKNNYQHCRLDSVIHYLISSEADNSKAKWYCFHIFYVLKLFSTSALKNACVWILERTATPIFSPSLDFVIYELIYSLLSNETLDFNPELGQIADLLDKSVAFRLNDPKITIKLDSIFGRSFSCIFQVVKRYPRSRIKFANCKHVAASFAKVISMVSDNCGELYWNNIKNILQVATLLLPADIQYSSFLTESFDKLVSFLLTWIQVPQIDHFFPERMRPTLLQSIVVFLKTYFRQSSHERQKDLTTVCLLIFVRVVSPGFFAKYSRERSLPILTHVMKFMVILLPLKESLESLEIFNMSNLNIIVDFIGLEIQQFLTNREAAGLDAELCLLFLLYSFDRNACTTRLADAGIFNFLIQSRYVETIIALADKGSRIPIIWHQCIERACQDSAIRFRLKTATFTPSNDDYSFSVKALIHPGGIIPLCQDIMRKSVRGNYGQDTFNLVHGVINLLNSNYGRDPLALEFFGESDMLSCIFKFIDICEGLLFDLDNFLTLDMTAVENTCHFLNSLTQHTTSQIILVRSAFLRRIPKAILIFNDPKVTDILMRILLRVSTNPDLVHIMVENYGYSKIFEELINQTAEPQRKPFIEELVKRLMTEFIQKRLDIVPIFKSLLDYTPKADMASCFQQKSIAVAFMYFLGPLAINIMIPEVVELAKLGAWAPSLEHVTRMWIILLDGYMFENDKHIEKLFRFMKKYVTNCLLTFKLKSDGVLSARLCSVFANVETLETNGDIRLRFSGAETIDLVADKNLLIAASPVFDAMLSGTFSESSGIIELDYSTKDEWRLALKLVSVAGKSEIVDSNLEHQCRSVFGLINLAEQYMWDFLICECMEFLQIVLTHCCITENFCVSKQVYQWTRSAAFESIRIFRDRVSWIYDKSLMCVILCLNNSYK